MMLGIPLIIYLSVLYLHSTIDVLDWNSLLDERTQTSDLLVVPNVRVSSIRILNQIIVNCDHT